MLRLTPRDRVLFLRRTTPVLLALFGVFSFLILNLRAPHTAYATAASTVNFQARLQSNTGAIVPDGYYNVEFKLYSAASGGSALWTEDYTATSGPSSSDVRIQVADGYLSTALGSITPFPNTIDWSQQLYLTMNIGGTGTTASWDGEMNPRLALTASPYAFKAGSAANASQLSTTSGANTSTLSIQAPTSGNQTFVIQDQGTSGTFDLLTTQAANNSFVQLQTGTPSQQTGQIDVSGAATVGSLLTTSLDTATNTGLVIGGTNATGVSLGNSGLNDLTTIYGSTLVKSATGLNSTTAFQVQNAAGINVLSVDTTSSKVNITGNSVAPSHVNHWGNSGSNVATLSVSPATIGNLLALAVKAPAGNSVASISGGGVNNWHKIISNDGSAHEELWEGTVTANGPSTITAAYVSAPSGNFELEADEFTAGLGAGTAWTVEASGSVNNSSSATIAYPSLTATQTNGAYFGYARANSSATAGSTSGFTYTATGLSNMVTYSTSITGGMIYSPTAVSSPADISDAVAMIITDTTGGLNVTNSLQVGGASNFNNNVTVNAGSSTTALQAQNASGASVFDVDTSNGRVGIGTNTPTAQLQVKNTTSNATLFDLQDSTGFDTMMATDAGKVTLGKAPAGSIGNGTIGTQGGNDLNDLLSQKFTTDALGGGAISSMSIYIRTAATGSPHLGQMGIYADTTTSCGAGATDCAGTLIASTAQTSLTGNGWNTWPITATLSPNTTYWLAYWSNDPSDGFAAMVNPSGAGSPLQMNLATTFSGSMPSTFPTISFNNTAYELSIYATYAGSGSQLTADPTSNTITTGYNTNIVFQGPAASISNPQGFTSSEAFGASASVSGTNATAVGNTASAAQQATSVGNFANSQLYGTAVGYGATSGQASVSLGYGAQTTLNGISIGVDAISTNYSIAIGTKAENSTGANHQLVIGSDTSDNAYISDTYLGSGVTDSTPQNTTLHATGACTGGGTYGCSGATTDGAGASLNIAGGIGTGAGNGGNINFQIAKPGTTGTSANSLSTVATISGANGGATFQNATNSTNAFQIQNTSNTNLLNIDTSGGNVNLGIGAPPSAMGYASVGGTPDGGFVSKVEADEFTATSNGTITSISVYVSNPDTTNNQYKVGIYTNTTCSGNPCPGTLIATSAAGTLSSTAGWNTLPVSATVTNTNHYWLAYMTNTSSSTKSVEVYDMGVGGALDSQSSVTFASGFPATFVPDGAPISGPSHSIYASFSAVNYALSLSNTGNFLATGSATFANATNSTAAFQVQNATGTSILGVDTSNGKVTINGGGTPLTVNTSSSSSEDGILFTLNGSNAGEVGISGNTGQIINQSHSGDLNLKSASGYIYLAAGGSSAEVTIDTNGNTTFKNTADSTTNSFQIQNQGGINLFSTNTSNKIVNVGASGADNLSTTVNIATTSANTQTVNIGTGAITTGTNTINIGNGATTSGVDAVSIGSNNSSSTTTIKGGNGGSAIALTTGTNGSIGLTANGTGFVGSYTNSATSGTLVKTLTNSTVGFQVQNATGANLVNVDTSGGNINLGIGAPPAPLGYTTAGGNTGTGYYHSLNANKFTATQTGTVSSMSVDIPTVTGGTHYQLGIYTDNSGAPNTYIASSASHTLSGGWNTTALTTSPTLTAGTTYWLVYWTDVTSGDNNDGMAYDSPITGSDFQYNTSAAADVYGSGASNGMPTSFPTSGTLDGGTIQHSIYVTFTSTGYAATISSTGALSVDGSATFASSTNSSTAFQIQNSSGYSVLTANTTGGQVVLGTASNVNGAEVFNNSTNGNTVTIKSGATTASYSLTLPTALGSAGQCLADTTGAGVLGWTSCGGSSSSLAISKVNEWDNSGGSGVSSGTVSTVSPTNIGDVLIAYVGIGTDNGVSSSVSGGCVGSWTKLANDTPNGAWGVDMWEAQITSTTCGTKSVTANFTSIASGGEWDLSVQEFTATGVSSSTTWSTEALNSHYQTAPGTTNVSFQSLTSGSSSNEAYTGYTFTGSTAQNTNTTTGFSYQLTADGNITTWNTSLSPSTSYAPTAAQSSNTWYSTMAAIIMATGSGGGGGSYINNGTTTQSGNLNVQAATSGTVAATLQANASGGGDILDLKDGSGDVVASFGSTGAATIRTGTATNNYNTTTAFQVQNNNGSNVLDVDTTNSAIVLGNDGTPGAVTVRGGAASGSNVAGANLTFQASNGTGSGGSGSFAFQTAAPSSAPASPIALDNKAAKSFTSAASSFTSNNFTVGTEGNMLLIAQVITGCDYTISNVKFGGTSMTTLATGIPASNTVSEGVYYLVGASIPSGTNTLTYNLSGSSCVSGYSLTTYYNVNTASPFGTEHTYMSGGAVTSMTNPIAATSSSQLVFDALGDDSLSTTAPSTSSPQTVVEATPGSASQYGFASSSQPGLNGTANAAWTVPSSNVVDIGVPINQETGGTSTTADSLSTVFTLANTGAATFQNNANSTTALQVENSSGAALLTADTSNTRIDIGSIGTATGQLYIAGSVASSVLSTTTTNGAAADVKVVGNYAYVISNAAGALTVYDVSNPASPTARGVVTTTSGYSNAAMAVAGKYAYVAEVNGTNYQIQAIDISNPYAPSSVSTLALTGNPKDIYVQGKYLYVAQSSNNKLQVIDISNPASPTLAGSASVTSGNAPQGVFVQGRYAYIVSTSTGGIQIFDISNPTNPTSVGGLTTGLGNAYNVYVQGRYAYITNNNAGTTPAQTVQVVDVSNPAAPSLAGTSGTLGSGLAGIFVQGRYAYTVSYNGDTFTTLDVSNPASPTAQGTALNIGAYNPIRLAVQGRYAYIADNGASKLQVVDLGGEYAQQLQAGGTETGTLQVDNNADVQGDLSLQGGLSVGGTSEFNSDVAINDNNLTTGNGLNITTTSNLQTAGSLVNITNTATLATGGGSDTANLINVSRSLTSNVTSGGGTGTPTLDHGSTFVTYPGTVTQTDSFTVNGGHSNYYMLVGVFEDANGLLPTSVKYGGVSMTLLKSGGIGGGSAGINEYGLVAPATGTNNLVVTGSQAGEWVTAVSDWYNVNQSTPTDTVPAIKSLNSGNPSITVTTTSGDEVVDFLANTTYSAAHPMTPGSGQATADYQGGFTLTYANASGEVGQSYLTASGSSTTMTWSNTSGSYYYGYGAVGLKGATTSGSETVSGAVASFSNNCTVTSGSCSDATSVLSLNQQYAGSTGAVLNIQNSGAGDMIDFSNSTGLVGSINSTSGSLGIQTASSLTGTAGSISVDTGTSGTLIAGNVENDTFESGIGNWQGWSGNGSVAQSTTKAHGGTHSLAITALGGSSWGIEDAGGATVIPGQSYVFSGWIYLSTSDTVYMQVQWGSNFTTVATKTIPANTWTQITGTGVAPAGATSENMYISNNVPETTGTLMGYLDDYTVSSGVVAPSINIGATNAQAITIGNQSQSGNTTLYGGSTIQQTINGLGTTFKALSDSTSLFVVQNASSSTLFNIDSSNNVITIGNGSTSVVVNGTLSAQQPGQSSGTKEVWHGITVDSGWTNGLSGYANVEYRLLPDGTLQLAGVATHAFASAGVTLNSSNPLPASYRPAYTHDFVFGDAVGSRMHCSINTSGVITCNHYSGQASGTMYAEIDGIISLN